MPQPADLDPKIQLDQMDLFDNFLAAWFYHAPNGSWVLKGHLQDFNNAARSLMDDMLIYHDNPAIANMYEILEDDAADQSAEPPHE